MIADAFCHNMVRALVGALLPVGEGSRPASWPAQVLAARRRDPAVRVVPPHGLSLEEVRYPEPEQLAAGRADPSGPGACPRCADDAVALTTRLVDDALAVAWRSGRARR